MDSLPRRSRRRLNPIELKSTIPAADDFAVARQRMRHLAPWHVEPLPLMHSAIGRPCEPLTTDHRERNEQLALQVLAVQIWLASAQSAMH